MTESAEHFSRRNFLKTVGSAAASLVTTSIDNTASSQSWNYPNVLVIFPDQWRRQAFGCYGDPVVRTPHLDRLAEQGVRFKRCDASNPVCSPSLAIFQTGRYAHQTGLIQNNLYLKEKERCFAEIFSENG